MGDSFRCLPGSPGYVPGLERRNDFHLRGTSLGGWLVLEPWITPSLFYQFLGLTAKYGRDTYKHVAIDSKSFCTALGNEEANRQLRQHWRTWVDEEQIANLARSGVETLRIPLGDWMYVPYAPYVGCWDGALEELDRVLELCKKYDLTVLLDIHAMRMSQNGLDNSGDTGSFEWLGNAPENAKAEHSPIVSRYRHWDIRGGNWIGDFNLTSQTYSTLNTTNIADSLETVRAISERYKDNSVVVGLTPVNEPWMTIPLDVLKDYYWKSYQIIQEVSPHWITLMHDSFRLSPESWGGPWMENCDNWAMDTHLYQAWSETEPSDYFIDVSCETPKVQNLDIMETLGVPVIVGEWSLASDNCAMWLNGLNDNVPGYPKHECDFVPCPQSYMGLDKKFAVPGKGVNTLDPMGTGGPSFVIDGTCPQDAAFSDEMEAVKRISYAKLNAYDQHTHGNFFWNFRTEFGTRWDYQIAVKNGWIPDEWAPGTKVMKEIANTCPGRVPSSNERAFGFSAKVSLATATQLSVLLAFVVLVVRSLYGWFAESRGNRRNYETIPSVELSTTPKDRTKDSVEVAHV